MESRFVEKPEGDRSVGKADANDEKGRLRNTPDRPVRPPADRHYISRIRRKIKPAQKTTFITSSVDVGKDLAMIRQGQAERNGEYYTVNGRTWFHEEGGRVFPVSGEGLVGPVGRGVIHALKAYARYNGINDLSDHEISMNHASSEQDREDARIIWNLREEQP